MDWNELQTDIFDIIQDGLCVFEIKKYTVPESEDMAKKIVDLIERMIDVPDTTVMRIADLQRELAELREKLRWIPVEDYEQVGNNNLPLECIVNFNCYDDPFDIYSLCTDEGSYFKILDPILNNSTNYRVTHVREIPELEAGE